MATGITRTLIFKDTGDSNRLKLLTGKQVELQPVGSTYPTGKIVLTETSVGVSGKYGAASVPDGAYEYYIDGIKDTSYPPFWIGDEALSPYALKAGGNAFTGNQTVTGFISATGSIYAFDYLQGVYPIIDSGSSWYTSNTPGLGNSLVWYSYLESRLSNLQISPFQESINKVRCFAGATQETNKVYYRLRTAAASFASPAINNQCLVQIEGTGAVSRYMNMDLTTQRDYVNFAAAGKHISIIMRDGATNSKITTFERCTIIFGAIDFTTDREFTNKTFIDCDIYAYKNTTYNNCTLIRCRFFHASTYKAILKGTTSAELCGFNNDPDYTLLSDPDTVVGSYFIKLAAMPSDPSTVEIPD